MMKCMWRLHKTRDHSTIRWCYSQSVPGVEFAVREVSLGERIKLTSQVRDLCARAEYLRAGESSERLEAGLNELLVKALYLEWGLVSVRGLRIDGKRATPETVICSGPETLSEEILAAIKAELGLTEEERKNS